MKWSLVYDKVKVVWYGLGAVVVLTAIDQFTAFDWSSVFGKWGAVVSLLVVALGAWARKEVVGHSAAVQLVRDSNGSGVFPPPMA